MEEILQLVRKRIRQTLYRDRLHAGAVLTGGTALLSGITDVAERILEMRCRCGFPQDLKGLAPVVSSPIYSTGVGLILHGIEAERKGYRDRRGMRRFLDYLVDTIATGV